MKLWANCLFCLFVESCLCGVLFAVASLTLAFDNIGMNKKSKKKRRKKTVARQCVNEWRAYKFDKRVYTTYNTRNHIHSSRRDVTF